MEYLAFKKGDIDYFTSINSNIKDLLITRDGKLRENLKDTFKMEVIPYLNTEYLGFLVDPGIKKDVKSAKFKKSILNKNVRKAINYAIDRNILMKYLRNNIGKAANKGIIPPVMLGGDTSRFFGYEFDPLRAQQLLNKAGYPNGKGLPEIVYIQEIFLWIYVKDCKANSNLPDLMLKFKKNRLFIKAMDVRL